MTKSKLRPPFLTLVHQQLDSFHPMERRVADFVIDFPGDMASYGASELARLAGVSNATVTRFIQRLGYRDYDEARRQVRGEREAGSPLFLASRRVAEPEPAGAHLAQTAANLQKTLARLRDDELDVIATALWQARRVWVTGFRSSQSFASYFRWQVFQLKEDVQVVPSAGDTLGQYAASMTPRDVAVVFGLRRRPAGLRAMVTQIVQSGAQVLYITDEEVARHRDVRWHLHCHCASESPLDDHSAVMTVCHLLLARLLALAGPQARERLGAIESRHEALHEL